jgi:hypothetical protein
MLFIMPLPPEWSLRAHTRLCALGFIASVVAGCSEQPTAPAEHRASPPASSAAVKFWDAGAAVAWNELATTHAARRPVNIFRLYAYLSLAQFRAAEAAEAIQPHPPISAAIAGASAVVLASYFPLEVAEIEAALDAQQAAPPWSGPGTPTSPPVRRSDGTSALG